MQFDIEEKDTAVLMEAHDSLKVINDFVIQIDSLNKQVQTRNGRIINYKMLCLCNGARPKLIEEHNNFILGIRDTESVLQFSQKIKNSRRIVIVGNGGIATELVNEVDGVEMIWVIKVNIFLQHLLILGLQNFLWTRYTKLIHIQILMLVHLLKE